MTQEALKLALEALEVEQTHVEIFRLVPKPHLTKAITTIKEALAKEKALQALHDENERLGLYKDAYAQQEPVAWRRREVGGGWQYHGWKETGMTYDAVNRSNKNGFECEAIPANPPQPEQEQEPKAWRTFDGEGGYDYCSYEDNESYADDWNKRNPNHKSWVDKLYTHSQRTWVGLTADEVFEICNSLYNRDSELVEMVEAKLKEKNT